MAGMDQCGSEKGLARLHPDALRGEHRRGLARGEFADLDAVTRTVLPGPDGDEAAIGTGGQHRLHLVARDVLRQQEIPAELVAGRVVALGIDAVAAAVLCRGGPGDDIAAIGQRRHAGLLLVTGDEIVDPRLTAQRATQGIVAPCEDAVSAEVQAALTHRDDHVAAIGQRGDHVLTLVVIAVGADPRNGADGGVAGGEDLGVDVHIVAGLADGVGPTDRIATAGQSRHVERSPV